MSNSSETAEAQSPIAYASVYAIIAKPTIHDDDCDDILFAARFGNTAWPCTARLFDDAESAKAAREELGLMDAQVVRLRLQYAVEQVA